MSHRTNRSINQTCYFSNIFGRKFQIPFDIIRFLRGYIFHWFSVNGGKIANFPSMYGWTSNPTCEINPQIGSEFTILLPQFRLDQKLIPYEDWKNPRILYEHVPIASIYTTLSNTTSLYLLSSIKFKTGKKLMKRDCFCFFCSNVYSINSSQILTHTACKHTVFIVVQTNTKKRRCTCDCSINDAPAHNWR